jgi:hypothetical protein
MRRDDHNPGNGRSQGPGPNPPDDDIPIVGIVYENGGDNDAEARPKTQRSIRRACTASMARARRDIMDPEALFYLHKALEFAEMRLQHLNAEMTALEQRYKRATWNLVPGGKVGA